MLQHIRQPLRRYRRPRAFFPSCLVVLPRAPLSDSILLSFHALFRLSPPLPPSYSIRSTLALPSSLSLSTLPLFRPPFPSSSSPLLPRPRLVLFPSLLSRAHPLASSTPQSSQSPPPLAVASLCSAARSCVFRGYAGGEVWGSHSSSSWFRLLFPPPSCLDIQPILLFFPSSSRPTSDRGWLACAVARHGENVGAHGWGHIEGCARGCFIERTDIVLLLSSPLASLACLPTFAHRLILYLVISTADGWPARGHVTEMHKARHGQGQARGCFLDIEPADVLACTLVGGGGDVGPRCAGSYWAEDADGLPDHPRLVYDARECRLGTTMRVPQEIVDAIIDNFAMIGGSDFGNIHFENPSVRRVDVPHEVRVVFESFKLELDVDAVDAMVSGFSTVDIKYLKSLVIDSSPIIPFLRENTETIQEVRINSSYYPRAPDPDILKANQTLHSIKITENNSRIVPILQRFGHLVI
ncbi:hypothetical protein C8J57DRAFT_1617777 [Mycena rebaudengoi]|nr:hypothetical protein C8J57DRAFT_1617777 [Mycena rebaudengoi]